MKTLRIIVKGRVQKVGYRRLVDEAAYNLGVTGYVKNLDDKKDVEVVAQHADDAVLKRFIQLIQIKEYPIKVERVETKEIEAEEYSDFKVIEGPLEMENRESLEAGTIYLRKLAGEMKETREDLGNKTDKFSEATQQRFDTVDDKYGKVSEKLGSIDNHLKELVEILRAFKPK